MIHWLLQWHRTIIGRRSTLKHLDRNRRSDDVSGRLHTCLAASAACSADTAAAAAASSVGLRHCFGLIQFSPGIRHIEQPSLVHSPATVSCQPAVQVSAADVLVIEDDVSLVL